MNQRLDWAEARVKSAIEAAAEQGRQAKDDIDDLIRNVAAHGAEALNHILIAKGDQDAEDVLPDDPQPPPMPTTEQDDPVPWRPESELLDFRLDKDASLAAGTPIINYVGSDMSPGQSPGKFDIQPAAKLIIPYGNYTFDPKVWDNNIGTHSNNHPANQHLIIEGELGPNGELPKITGTFDIARKGEFKHSPSRFMFRNLHLESYTGGRKATVRNSYWRELVLENFIIENHSGGKNGIMCSTGKTRLILNNGEIKHCGGFPGHGVYAGGIDEILINNVKAHGMGNDGHCFKLYANKIRMYNIEASHYGDPILGAPELFTPTWGGNPLTYDGGGIDLLDLDCYADIVIDGATLTRKGPEARKQFISLRNRLHAPTEWSNGFGITVPTEPVPHIFRNINFVNESSRSDPVYAIRNEGIWPALYYQAQVEKNGIDSNVPTRLRDYLSMEVLEAPYDQSKNLGLDVQMQNIQYSGAYGSVMKDLLLDVR